MVAVSSVTALTSALVHQSVSARPLERARHEHFIAHKLAVSFAALAFAPFFLAYRGAPTLPDALMFAIGLVPLTAAMLVARTGRIVAGHALLSCGLLAFGLTLSFGTRAGPGAALAWIILAQWEAVRAGDRRLGWITSLLCCGALALIVAAASGGESGATTSTALLVGALALAYAVTTATTAFEAPEAVDPPESRVSDRIMALSEAMGDLVVSFDGGGSVVEINGRSEMMLGLAPRDLLGRGFFQIVHVADRPAFLKLVADAARSAGPQTATIRLRAQDEATAGAYAQRFPWTEIRIQRLESGLMAVVRDVTATYRHEQEIAVARHAIETSVRSKDDFLATMSHELRTPLNAIIGFSEMLASRTMRPANVDKQRDYARIIHQSGQHLLSVVNSILDMSKIQSGTFSILPEPFELRPLIDQCFDIVRLKAQEGRLRLVCDCPVSLDPVVGDKRAYKQILINLLSNAVKFTPENGEVKLSAKPDGTAILIIVSDTGIGIGGDDLARLGDPFFQARSSTDRPFEGTGLGLSVVRGLIGLHGGALTIESEPGRGTSVAVRLPADCQSVTTKTATATIETIPRRASPNPARRPFEPRMKSIA